MVLPSSLVLLHINIHCFSDFSTSIPTSFNILMKCFLNFLHVRMAPTRLFILKNEMPQNSQLCTFSDTKHGL